MTAPTVKARAGNTVSSNTTSVSVTMPTRSAGDLLIAAVGTDGSPSMTPSSPWVELYEGGHGADGRLGVFARIASGASDTLTVTLGASEQAGCLSWSIEGHAVSDVATDIIKFPGTNNTSPATVPTLTGLNPALDYLCLVAQAGQSGLNAANSGYATAAPGGSGGWTQFRNQRGSGTNSGNVQTAEGSASGVSSLNPGTMAVSGARDWGILSLAIPGLNPVTQKVAVGSTLLDGVDDIRVGASVVNRVYVGTELVYGSAP